MVDLTIVTCLQYFNAEPFGQDRSQMKSIPSRNRWNRRTFLDQPGRALALSLVHETVF